MRDNEMGIEGIIALDRRVNVNGELSTQDINQLASVDVVYLFLFDDSRHPNSEDHVFYLRGLEALAKYYKGKINDLNADNLHKGLSVGWAGDVDQKTSIIAALNALEGAHCLSFSSKIALQHLNENPGILKRVEKLTLDLQPGDKRFSTIKPASLKSCEKLEMLKMPTDYRDILSMIEQFPNVKEFTLNGLQFLSNEQFNRFIYEVALKHPGLKILDGSKILIPANSMAALTPPQYLSEERVNALKVLHDPQFRQQQAKELQLLDSALLFSRDLRKQAKDKNEPSLPSLPLEIAENIAINASPVQAALLGYRDRKKQERSLRQQTLTEAAVDRQKQDAVEKRGGPKSTPH